MRKALLFYVLPLLKNVVFFTTFIVLSGILFGFFMALSRLWYGDSGAGFSFPTLMFNYAMFLAFFNRGDPQML